jgi:hypothetical protein
MMFRFLLIITVCSVATQLIAGERKCVFEDEKLYSSQTLFSGSKYVNRSDDEYVKAVQSLPVIQREVIIQAIADFEVSEPNITFKDMILTGPDEKGRDILVAKVRVNKKPDYELYLVNQGRGENPMISVYRKVGMVTDLKRPLLTLVARITDATVDYCEYSLRVK